MRQSRMDAHMPDPSDINADAPPERTRRVGALRQSAILREIEQRSRDPELSAVAVAAVLGITPRYVHLLLKETGFSFSRHVLEKRLQRAITLLRDPSWRDRRIADVATEAGFTDLSHFSRAFRRRFGTTPSETRAAARGDSGFRQ